MAAVETIDDKQRWIFPTTINPFISWSRKLPRLFPIDRAFDSNARCAKKKLQVPLEIIGKSWKTRARVLPDIQLSVSQLLDWSRVVLQTVSRLLLVVSLCVLFIKSWTIYGRCWIELHVTDMSQWHDNSDTRRSLQFAMHASRCDKHIARPNGCLLGSQCVIYRARLRDLAIQ